MKSSLLQKKLSKKFKKRFKQDVLFKEVTTFKIGGPIKFFVEIKSVKELRFVLKLAKKTNTKWFVLGGGSNILAKDEGFSGIVVSMLKFDKIKFFKTQTKVFAGVKLGKFVLECKKHELSGLEWAVGIPGTLGGAVVMNAGAFGSEICKNLKSVTFFDGKRVKTLKTKKLNFSYRNSFFKNHKNYVVLSAKLKLFKEKAEKIQQNLFKFVNLRQKTQNVGFASAGSVFKCLENCSASKLVDMAGLKGKRFGDAMVSPVHAGFVVNICNATFKDVANLVDFICVSVYNRFSEKLELEIIVVGD